MTLRIRLLMFTDRALGVMLALLLVGSSLAFGGLVWWGSLAIAILSAVVVLLGSFRILLQGKMRLLKSPLMFLGLLGLGLGVFQVLPLPGGLAEKLSPASRSVYGPGILPEPAKTLDPTVELPETPSIRSPISIDRPATLHWLSGATACLVVFWGVGQYVDRLRHLQIVVGSIITAFFLNTSVAVVQLSARARGLYGFIEPGLGPGWAPTSLDLLAAPGQKVLRVSGMVKAGHPTLALSVPEPDFYVGTQLGGPEAYLALGILAMPLALGMTLQLLAPRGSREPLRVRLGQSSEGSLVILLYGALLVSALIVGILAGPWLSIPFALALLITGLPVIRATGLGWMAVSLTFGSVLLLAAGVGLGQVWAQSNVFPAPVLPRGIGDSWRVWVESLPITRIFPWFGTGLGTFGTIHPVFKSQDASSTTAMSSILQWWIEAGYLGLIVLGLAAFWCLVRLPGGVKRVGTADRSLVFGLIAAAFGFTLYSATQWTVELPAVALAAGALGGIGNRWLSGGTDLFVERG